MRSSHSPSIAFSLVLSAVSSGRFAASARAAGAGPGSLVAGGLAATAAGDSVALLTLALILLGLGWNFGLVSGTALATDAIPLDTRAKTQASSPSPSRAPPAPGLGNGRRGSRLPRPRPHRSSPAIALLPAIIASAYQR
jgi:hypothetical protein